MVTSCGMLSNCSAENKRRSKHVQKSLNPEWNQTVIYKNIHLEQVNYKHTGICIHQMSEKPKEISDYTLMEYTFFSFNIPCQLWGFNYMKALQRESQALGANREKSVVSQKYFSLIKTKELLLRQLLTDVIDMFLLDYWSEANSS